ncbi:hypothetical protein BDV95DRAFT_70784 [Massariosphaeria phaeospora]|uniref:C3H1-type domain-containing protein n=1 Tax=Massariosphaeria phaeospora TaxID=100035 RepID=A0A7C8I4V2_9PLEO|nr:hypothetical protein BDV95DRAFT_70784 [Massariosphaeria phaeospora]
MAPPEPRLWWKENRLPDEIKYTPFQDAAGNKREGIRTWDFIERSDRPLIICGPIEYLVFLASHLALGYRQQPTSAADYLCGLYALEISLKPVYNHHGLTPPDFNRLLHILQSREFRELAGEAFQEFWAAVMPTNKRAEIAYKDDRSNLTAKKELDFMVMSHILKILRRRDGLRIALGILTKHHGSGEHGGMTRYNCQLDEGPALKHDRDDDHDYHGIVWLINDNWERCCGPPDFVSRQPVSEEERNVSHWSGVAPDWDDLEPVVSAPTTNTSSTIPQNPPPDAIGFNQIPQSVPDPFHFTPVPGLFTFTPDLDRIVNPTRPGPPVVPAPFDLASPTDTASTIPQTPPTDAPGSGRKAVVAIRYRNPSKQTQERTAATARAPAFPAPFPSDFFKQSTKRRASQLDDFSQQERVAQRRKNNHDGIDLTHQQAYQDLEAEHAMQGIVHGPVKYIPLYYTLKQKEALLQQYYRPPGSNVEIRDDVTHISATVQDMEYYAPRFLYEDVHGVDPEFHTPLHMHDVDLHNTEPLSRTLYDFEVQRAKSLRRKPIFNAPSHYDDLPWAEMSDIRIEELLIYFPNHVLHWPGLALGFRKQNWDRLFFRATRLINLARESHDSRRDYKHAEPLPMMMKVEQAIKELEPRYTLADHTPELDEMISWDFVIEKMRMKPVSWANRYGDRTCTLEEAAGYVTGINEFEGNSNYLFTQRIRHLHGAHIARMRQQAWDNPFQPAPAPSPPTQTLGRKDRKARVPSAVDADMTDLGFIADDDNVDDLDAPAPERDLPVCPHGTKCRRKDVNGPLRCVKLHFDPPEPRVDGTQPVEPSNRLCHNDPNCNNQSCRFEHPQRDATATQPRGACRNDPDCKKRNCRFAHPQRDEQRRSSSPTRSTQPPPPPPTQPDTRQPRPCRNDPRCTRPNCAFAHPQRDQRRGSTASTSADQQPANPAGRNTPVCRNRSKCRNAACTFRHPSPAAPPNVQVTDEACKWGVRCTSAKCVRSHPSPAARGSGGSGAGRGRGGAGGGGGGGGGGS